MSNATNLVPRDTNVGTDAFVRDRKSGTASRVNLGPRGTQANNGLDSLVGPHVTISANGRFVTFSSSATNLVPGDTNGLRDVFVRDRQAYRTDRVSVGPNGAQGNGDSSYSAISADGRFNAFASQATNRVDGGIPRPSPRSTSRPPHGQTQLVSVGPNAPSGTVSAWPRPCLRTAASSPSVRLGQPVPGDDNGAVDIFVRDRKLHTTKLLSLGPAAAASNQLSDRPAISANGRIVAFRSDATNVVPAIQPGQRRLRADRRRTDRGIIERMRRKLARLAMVPTPTVPASALLHAATDWIGQRIGSIWAEACSAIAPPPSDRRRMAKGAVRLCTVQESRIVVTTIAHSSPASAKLALPRP